MDYKSYILGKEHLCYYGVLFLTEDVVSLDCTCSLP
jgi:hypothetical protein